MTTDERRNTDALEQPGWHSAAKKLWKAAGMQGVYPQFVMRDWRSADYTPEQAVKAEIERRTKK